MDISHELDDKVFWVDGLSSINLNQTESESHSDYYNIYNVVGKQIPFHRELTT